MRLNFSKMHGLGNDFVVFDAIAQKVRLSPEQIRFIADRRFGIGCDQVLLVEAGQAPGVDFAYRIFNADGGEVEQCGNGARCFARFVRDHGLSDKDEIVVATQSGIIRPRLEPDGQVTVDMGQPSFHPQALPFLAERESLRYPLEVGDVTLSVGAVSMGNPHLVLQVDEVDRAPVAELGPLLENHPRFPRRVNAGFMQVVDGAHIRLRVFERGSGETLACGTGACAAMVMGRRWGFLHEQVEVSLRGGTLRIHWPGEGSPVRMTGPAVEVFEGRIDL
jgi:diaminopimelate epimerase